MKFIVRSKRSHYYEAVMYINDLHEIVVARSSNFDVINKVVTDLNDIESEFLN